MIGSKSNTNEVFPKKWDRNAESDVPIKIPFKIRVRKPVSSGKPHTSIKQIRYPLERKIRENKNETSKPHSMEMDRVNQRELEIQEEENRQMKFLKKYEEGVINLNRGRFTESISNFEDALRINPNHYKAQKYLIEAISAELNQNQA